MKMSHPVRHDQERRHYLEIPAIALEPTPVARKRSKTKGRHNHVSDRRHGAFSIDSIEKSPHSPQHFLYFRPLPHGQGSFRPTFFAATIVFGGFNKISRSLISSGSSGSNPIVNFQPFFSNSDATSFIRFSVCTRTMAGFFSVPNFAAFFPSNIFAISSPF